MQKNIRRISSITPSIKKEIVQIIDERIKDVHVTKEDFSELKGIVKEVAQVQKELAEAQKRTEIRVEELVVAQKELAEAQKRTEIRMDMGFKQLNDRITALGSRWGIMAEDTFRNAISELLRTTGYSVSKGIYGGREVDIVVKNGEHILLEITSSMKKSDIPKYIASAEDYEKQMKTSPRIMVAAIFISPTVMREIMDAPRKIEIFSME